MNSSQINKKKDKRIQTKPNDENFKRVCCANSKQKDDK